MVMNEQIHAARYVTKTHSKDVATSRSPDAGPVGTVYAGQVLWLTPHPTGQQHPCPLPLRVETISARVDLVKAYAGADRALVEAAVSAGAKGLVVEAMGVGNLPAPMRDAVATAAHTGVFAVLTTRCGVGPVTISPLLREAGVLAAGLGLNGQKARIVLLAALSAGLCREDIARAYWAFMPHWAGDCCG